MTEYYKCITISYAAVTGKLMARSEQEETTLHPENKSRLGLGHTLGDSQFLRDNKQLPVSNSIFKAIKSHWSVQEYLIRYQSM